MSLNRSNLREAEKHVGKHSSGTNCWGLTAFLLGWRQKFEFMGERLMKSRLRNRMQRIEKPKRFRIGDVCAIVEVLYFGPADAAEYRELYGEVPEMLAHTAVYVGRGLWLHQLGYCGKVKLHPHATMVRSYKGESRYYRAAA